MVPTRSKCNKSLAELDDNLELLKELVNESISTRDFYVRRNELNEIELKRLVHIKEKLAYLKDVLLQDLYKSNINAGKRRIVLRRRLEEFHEKNYSAKLKNLPAVSMLNEFRQSNEQLIKEHLRCTKILDALKKEYSQKFYILEHNLKMKIIEFSQVISELSKKKDKDLIFQ